VQFAFLPAAAGTRWFSMQKLVEGIHRFQAHLFSTQRELFLRLAKGQHPLALFITCSDSRIDPSLLTQTDPGELFIMRNAGNIIPPYGTISGGESATIEYAVSVLKVKDIIVCGHSLCGAMGALLHPEQLDELPAVQAWLRHADSTARIMKENYGHITAEGPRLTATVEENVLVQLEHLRTHPSVAAALGRGDLKLHGWVYKFETGQVFGYDPVQAQYVSVIEAPTHPQSVPGRLPVI
jgi:carbonic anhydrase